QSRPPNKTFLPPDTFVEQVQRRFTPIYKSRLPNGKVIPERAGVSWIDDEEVDIKTIAAAHKRTRRSILVRLARNGRVPYTRPCVAHPVRLRTESSLPEPR